MEDDTIAMYLIVRESLNMSIGKTAAQCSHAAQKLQIKFEEVEGKILCSENDQDDDTHQNLYEEWLNNDYPKIVLKADEKEWIKLKESLSNYDVLIIDSGRTELLPNTETVIGIFPMRKNMRCKLLKRLQVLK
jgi:peptidyl-tRNA hydrolase